MNTKKLVKIATNALEELKGKSIVGIDVKKLTQITDYMIVVTGTSNTHVKALADEVVKELKAADVNIVGVEGRQQAEWILVDAGDIVVHIMLAPVRALYNLEDLWNFDSETVKELGV